MSEATRLQIPRVSLGDDGTLFLIGGSNAAIDLYQPEPFKSKVPLEQWRGLLEQRTAFFSERNIPWQMILAPEKLSIYGQAELRKWIDGPSETPGEAFVRLTGNDPHLLYPMELLRTSVDEGRIYPKTDSHWTSLAALLVFKGLASKLNFDVDISRYASLSEKHLRYHGDLWTSDFADIEKDVFIRKRVSETVRTIYKNPLMGLKSQPQLENEAGLHVGSHVIWINEDAPIKKKVILFGSSFSECRLECSLLSYMIIHSFHELHFIWSTSLDFDYIHLNRPDLVLLEMPERFLTKCPNDDFKVEDFGVETAKNWTKNNSTS
jgi:alginate O-acetyltransferase complex protein AlgJ